MRITVVSGTYPPELNGVANFVKTLVEALIRQGHEIQLIVSSPEPEKVEIPEGVMDYLVFKGKKVRSYPSISFVPTIPYGKIRSAITHFNPDVIHLNTVLGIDIAALKAARELGVPTVFTYHTHYDFFAESITRYLLGKFFKVVRPAVRVIFGKWIYEFASLMDAVVAPTNFTKRILEEKGVEKVFRINNPVTIFPKVKRDWSSTGRILHVGRISYEKRLEVLLKVASLLPQYEFIITSKGSAEKYYRKLAAELGLKNVVFTGFLPEKELKEVYASADLFFSPAMYDTFNIAGAQAMAAGLPIVAHRTGGLGELVNRARCGYALSPPPALEAKAFSEVIESLMEDEIKRKKFGIRARRYAKNFIPDVVAEKYVKIYENVSPWAAYRRKLEYIYRVGIKIIDTVATLIS